MDIGMKVLWNKKTFYNSVKCDYKHEIPKHLRQQRHHLKMFTISPSPNVDTANKNNNNNNNNNERDTKMKPNQITKSCHILYVRMYYTLYACACAYVHMYQISRHDYTSIHTIEAFQLLIHKIVQRIHHTHLDHIDLLPTYRFVCICTLHKRFM